MNNLIIFSGKKQVGKDTFASFFIKYNKIAFADELKDQLCNYFDYVLGVYPRIHIKDFWNNKDKIVNYPFKNGECKTIRFWMQWYGQLMKKHFGKYYWIDYVVDMCKIWNKEFKDDIIILDARFPQEIDRVKKLLSGYFNIKTVRIIRNTKYEDEDKDISEIALDKKENSYWDFIIENNGSLKDLKNEYKRLNEKL